MEQAFLNLTSLRVPRTLGPEPSQERESRMTPEVSGETGNSFLNETRKLKHLERNKMRTSFQTV